GPGQPHSVDVALEAQPREPVAAIAAHPWERLPVSASAAAIFTSHGTVSGGAPQPVRSRLPNQNVIRPGAELWRAVAGLAGDGASTHRGDVPVRRPFRAVGGTTRRPTGVAISLRFLEKRGTIYCTHPKSLEFLCSRRIPLLSRAKAVFPEEITSG